MKETKQAGIKRQTSIEAKAEHEKKSHSFIIYMNAKSEREKEETNTLLAAI